MLIQLEQKIYYYILKIIILILKNQSQDIQETLINAVKNNLLKQNQRDQERYKKSSYQTFNKNRGNYVCISRNRAIKIGKENGRGMLKTGDNKYQGNFQNNNLHGFGILKGKFCYIGEYVNSQISGYGIGISEYDLQIGQWLYGAFLHGIQLSYYKSIWLAGVFDQSQLIFGTMRFTRKMNNLLQIGYFMNQSLILGFQLIFEDEYQINVNYKMIGRNLHSIKYQQFCEKYNIQPIVRYTDPEPNTIRQDKKNYINMQRLIKSNPFQSELRSEIISTDGVQYKGYIQNGLYHGFGILRESGVEYQGNFIFGQKQGYGSLCFQDGASYSGYWYQNAQNGWGVYKVSKRYLYRGQFKNGKFHGVGICQVDNDIFVGRFKNNKMRGTYVKLNSNNQLIFHDFNIKSIKAFSVVVDKDGQIFEAVRAANGIQYHKIDQSACFMQQPQTNNSLLPSISDNYDQENRFNSQLISQSYIPAVSQNTIYRGNHVPGDKQPYGSLYYQDGSSYSGYWFQNDYNGWGVYKTSNGSVYKGLFRKGRFRLGICYIGRNIFVGEFNAICGTYVKLNSNSELTFHDMQIGSVSVSIVAQQETQIYEAVNIAQKLCDQTLYLTQSTEVLDYQFLLTYQQKKFILQIISYLLAPIHASSEQSLAISTHHNAALKSISLTSQLQSCSQYNPRAPNLYSEYGKNARKKNHKLVFYYTPDQVNLAYSNTLKDGEILLGCYNDDQYLIKKGFIYYGNFLNPKNTVFQTLVKRNNTVFLGGRLENNEIQGTELRSDGTLFVGSWFSEKSSRGSIIYPQGDEYLGSFNNIYLKEGLGVYYWPKVIYIGSWINGKQDRGSILFKNDQVLYSGEFKNGLKHGDGGYVQHKGKEFSILEGKWQHDQLLNGGNS